jgi:hypothetical protein
MHYYLKRDVISPSSAVSAAFSKEFKERSVEAAYQLALELRHTGMCPPGDRSSGCSRSPRHIIVTPELRYSGARDALSSLARRVGEASQ